MSYEYAVSLSTTGGDVRLSKTCLPMFDNDYVSNESTRLYCSEPVRLVRCRANQIMKMAEEAMYKRPDSVTLVYSSLTYFELVVGSNTAKFSWG